MLKSLPTPSTAITRLEPLKQWGSRHAKLLAVLLGAVLTLPRMLALVDGPQDGKSIPLDYSWMMSLPATLDQNEWLGRDIFFSYGPLAQLITWLGKSLNLSGSAFDGFAYINLTWRVLSLILFSTILLLIKQIDWKFTLVLFLLANLLNLVLWTDYNRSWALVFTAVLLARIINSPRRRTRLWGAGGIGLLAVVLELYTTDQGLYSLAGSVVVLLVLAGLGGWKRLKTLERPRYYLEMAGLLLVFFLLGNLIVSLVFKLTSSNYQGFFDFQVLSLEEVRSYNYTQGYPWGFLSGATFTLVLIAIYIFWYIVRYAFKLSATALYTLVSLLIFSLITFKSAMIRSDIGHIVLGITPMVFLFLVLGASGWQGQIQPITTTSNPESESQDQNKTKSETVRWGWAVVVLALFATWPVTNLAPLTDLGSTLDGHLPLLPRLKQARLQNTPPDQIVPADLRAVIRPTADLLVFPYDNYLAIGLRQPLVAPVLQAYAANTLQLQQTYVAQVERRKSNLEVIYGLEGKGVDTIDGVQYVTRLPLIFEEFYHQFEAKTPAMLGKGMLVLKPRSQPVSPTDMHLADLTFKVEPKANHEQIIRLNGTANCSMLRLTSRLNYPFTSLLGRPAPLNLAFFDDKTAWLGVRFVSAEPGQTITNYIQLVGRSDFAKVFSSQPVPTRRLNGIQLNQVKTDLFDVTPSDFQLSRIECVTFAR